MAKTTDKVIGNIYESYDYTQFKVLPENRGHKETSGIKERKIIAFQKMIDAGRWKSNLALVKVNTLFEIVDGAHTFEVSRRNGLPIHYIIVDDAEFNEVSKRDLIGNMFDLNTVTTTWTAAELFNAACQVKAPLALNMKALIEENDNYFLWTDLMALLKKDSSFFIGRWRAASMKSFEDKKLLEAIYSNEFAYELKHFIALNNKVRIAVKKGIILKAAYDILWNAGEHVDKKLFRKALASVPDTLVTSQRTQTDDGCRRLLVQHYNKSQGQAAETGAVIFALKHKGGEEVLEIQ